MTTRSREQRRICKRAMETEIDTERKDIFTLHISHARVAFDVRRPWVLSDMRRRFAAGESLDATVDEVSVALHVLNIFLTCKPAACALIV
jgi:hypothetical protein